MTTPDEAKCANCGAAKSDHHEDDGRTHGFVAGSHVPGPTRSALERRVAELTAALRAVLAAPMTAPESCFNTTHQGLSSVPQECDDCDQERADHAAVQAALEGARAALTETEETDG